MVPVANVIISAFKYLKRPRVKIMEQNIHIKRIQNCFFCIALIRNSSDRRRDINIVKHRESVKVVTSGNGENSRIQKDLRPFSYIYVYMFARTEKYFTF